MLAGLNVRITRVCRAEVEINRFHLINKSIRTSRISTQYLRRLSFNGAALKPFVKNEGVPEGKRDLKGLLFQLKIITATNVWINKAGKKITRLGRHYA